MEKAARLNMLCLQHEILVPGVERHLDDVSLECKRQKVHNGQEVHQSAHQAHQLRSLDMIS